jgi:hypothetical protein
MLIGLVRMLRCMQQNPDEELLVAVGDALQILARALGPDAYLPIFAQRHADALLKWTRASQPSGVRAAGVGGHSSSLSLLKQMCFPGAVLWGSFVHAHCQLFSSGMLKEMDHIAGALGELAREMGGHMEPFVGRLMPTLLRELRSDSSGNRRNAAFACGMFAQVAPSALVPHLPSLLQVWTAAPVLFLSSKCSIKTCVKKGAA